jgi:hypothetical protein
MKFVKILILTLAVVAGTSCTLDLRDNPNAVLPGDILPSLVLNGMQISLANMFQPASTIGMQLTRLQNGGSAQYDRSVTPEGMNGIWTNAYANILVEANSLIPSADALGYARHAGIARVISAYTLIMLVDFFDDVPFSQAFAGSANFNPALDDASDVYNQAIAMLDQAKLDLTTNTTLQNPPGYQNPIAPAITDMYYNNNYTNWVRLANTLKLKIYLNTKNATEINNLINDVSSTGGFIDAQNRNFIFRYGLSTAAPDSRHPRFIANYPAGGGNYMSNWLIWHMYHGYDATQNGAPGDPRIRFYFYRQTTVNSSNAEQIRCLGEDVPSHYPISTGSSIIVNAIAGMPPMGIDPTHPTNDPTDPAWGRTFCYPTNVGYWGRDHVDPQGIPPDGLLRTAWGAYPAGGRFDNNSGAAVNANVGQRGAGFQPIMMRSYVQFMLAEAKLTITGVTAGLPALTYFQNGINQSMQDVRDWAVNGTYGTTGVAASPTEAATINAFYPAGTYTTDVANYVAAATAAFNNSAADAENYNAREFWIACFGNGVEAYNLYRRTGKPTGMQPALNPSPGPFPRSVWYPANAANLNNQINQKADLSNHVFWDTNTTNLDF